MQDGVEVKSDRLLAIYMQLTQGEVLKKQNLAEQFRVSQRSIQRDIEQLRSFFAEQMLAQDITYDRQVKGYYLTDTLPKGLTNSEILAVCKILLESRSMTRGEMVPILDKLVDCCVPAESRRAVQDLLANEKFLYWGNPSYPWILLDNLHLNKNHPKTQGYARPCSILPQNLRHINNKGRIEIQPLPFLSLAIFLPQALVSFLILPPQLICGPQFPLWFLHAHIKLQHCFRVARLRVKVEVAGHHALPRSLLRQLCPIRLIACQLMGRVDPPQKLLWCQLPIQILHPGQARVLAPCSVLIVVHGNQVRTFSRRGILPAQKAGIHPIPQLVVHPESTILFFHQVPFEP